MHPVVASKPVKLAKPQPGRRIPWGEMPQEMLDQHHALEIAQVAAEIHRSVHTLRESIVRRGGGGAFGSTSLDWNDVAGRVTWSTWLASTAQEIAGAKLSPEQWARATAANPSDWPARARALVTAVWVAALDKSAAWQLELPAVLDIRGLPSTRGMLDEDFVNPLADALKRIAVRGVVLLVDDNSWALERCLP